MRKLIATVSIALSVVFALALANADDTTSSNQQPGTSDTTTSTDTSNTTSNATTGSDTSANPSNPSMGGTTSSAQDQLKNAKSCTDANGITYHPKQKGFNNCIKAMKKQMESQAGGQTGSSTSGSTDTSGTSSSGTSSSGSGQ